MGNIASNLKYRIINEIIPDTTTLDMYVKGWKAAGLRYAEAHSELTVYNDAQWQARQAAIEIGNRDWKKAESALLILKDNLTSDQKWSDYAGVVRMGDSGPMPY